MSRAFRPERRGDLLLRIGDIGKTALIRDCMTEYTEYNLNTKSTQETLTNKTITDLSNDVSAGKITSDGIVYSISGTPAVGEVLTNTGPNSLEWAAPGSASFPTTAKGDLLACDGTAGTVSRLPVGANGQFLVANSAASTGLSYTNTLAGATMTSPTVSGTLTWNAPTLINGTGQDFTTEEALMWNSVDNKIYRRADVVTFDIGNNGNIYNKTISTASNNILVGAVPIDSWLDQNVKTNSDPTFNSITIAPIPNIQEVQLTKPNPSDVLVLTNAGGGIVTIRDGVYDVVGTNLSQTLTNKTIAFGSNTITGLPVSSTGYAAYYPANNVTIANSTDTIIPFDTSLATDSGVSNSAGTFTINTTGLYNIVATVGYLANATGFRRVYIMLNASTLQYGQSRVIGNGTIDGFMVSSFTAKLTAGDTIKVMTLQSSGGNLSLLGFSGFAGTSTTMVQFTRVS
jgi:hypothetical protein